MKAGEDVYLSGSFGDVSGMITPGSLYLASDTQVLVHPLATTTYQLEVTNALGNKARTTTTVTVHPNAMIRTDLAHAPYITTQDSFNASVPDQPSTTYQWSATGATILHGQGTPFVQVRADAVGPATLTCSVHNATGESDLSTTNLTIVAPPDATISAPWPKAPFMTLGRDGYTVSVPSGQPDVRWTYGGGLEVVSSTTTSLTLRGRDGFGTDQPVTCLVTNLAGQTASSQMVLKLVHPPLIQSFTCVKPVLNAGEQTQLRFTFSGGEGVVLPEGTPVTVNIYYGYGSLDIAPTSDRTYTLQVTNSIGDVATADVQVRFVPPPLLTSFTASDTYSDPTRGVQLTAQFSQGTAVLDPGAVPMQSGLPVTVNPAIPTRYRVTVTNEAGALLQAHQVVIPSRGLAESLYSSYAIDGQGQLYGWGSNNSGQLGLPSRTPQPRPIAIPGLTGIRMAAAGRDLGGDGDATGFLVALKEDGTVWTCGANAFSQLGLGHTTNTSTPTQVPGLSDIRLVACGFNRVIALKGDGTVWTWGGTTGTSTPTQDPSLTKVVLVAANNSYLFALKEDGTLWYWAQNGGPSPWPDSQIQDPLAIHQGLFWKDGKQLLGLYQPVDASGAIGYDENGNLLMADGRVLLYGFAGNSGFTPLAGGSQAIRWSGRTLLKSDGSLHAWGRNAWGEAGDALPLYQPNPVTVLGLGPVAEVAFGGQHTGARLADGSLWGWGYQNFSQVPSPWASMPSVQAIPIPGPSATAGTHGTVAATQWDLWAFDSSAGLANWDINGSNAWPALPGFVTAAGGNAHVLALTSNGTLWANGVSDQGQLGIGSGAAQSSPTFWTQVPDVSAITAIAAGRAHSLALRSDGQVLGFGQNDAAQLGSLAGTTLWVPTLLPDPTSVKAIAATDDRSAAVKQDGTVWMWGKGNGPTPVQVQGLSDIVAIALGTDHGVALRADGTVWTWGLNEYGELGLGDTAAHAQAAQVPGLSQIVAVYARDHQSGARDASGHLFVWGADAPWGPLGQGRQIWYSTVRPLPGTSPLW